MCWGKMHLSKKSLVYFLILITIWAYKRNWYKNIDFEFFPSLFIISSKFVILNVNIHDWAQDSLKIFQHSLEFFFLDQNITFSNYAQGTALPKNTKKSGEVLKYNVSMKNGSPQYQHNLASQPLSSRELGIAQPIWQCMLSPFMIYECLSIHPWLLTNIAGE